MQIYYKEKALLANQYKLEKVKKTPHFVKKYWLNIILFGIFWSVVGPVYTVGGRKPIDSSDFGHLGTGVTFAVIYIFCMTIAYFTGKYQRRNKIKRLRLQRQKLLKELEILKSENNLD